MRILPYVFLLLMGMSWRCVQSTCVFETDFGLSINCGIKKSGIFRVRNLGGLKGYVGLGLQLADELGFKESLSTLEQNSKRRSVNGFSAPGSFESLVMPQNNNRGAANGNQDRSAYAKMNGRALGGNQPTVPPFRPLMSAANNLVRNVRLSVQQQQQPDQLLKPLPVPAFAALPESIAKVAVEKPQRPVAVQRQPAPVAAIVPLAVGRLPMQPQPPQPQQQQQQQMIMAMQPMPPAALVALPQPMIAVRQPPNAGSPPEQQPHSPVYRHGAMQQAADRRFNAFAPSSQNVTDTRPIIVYPVIDNRNKKPENLPLSNEVDPSSMMSLFNAAAANNVSVEQLAIALRLQQQKNMSPFYPTPNAITAPTSTSTTTTTTTTVATPLPTPSTIVYVPEELPVTKKISIKPYKSKYSSGHKVMNAPKEYYPVSYDKNFDDNFVSKVDLPDTSFSCGDQKHFPGLYGDEDLGCMVFHVCAFTDDGLTQKSFLCPESTLFDQTILKCNWWFYVDCKSSRKLYDSNIPVSKSYQLMKALTFFSEYSAGPTVDASVAAATAAVSPQRTSDADASPSPTRNAVTTTTEVLENVSFKRR